MLHVILIAFNWNWGLFFWLICHRRGFFLARTFFCWRLLLALLFIIRSSFWHSHRFFWSLTLWKALILVFLAPFCVILCLLSRLGRLCQLLLFIWQTDSLPLLLILFIITRWLVKLWPFKRITYVATTSNNQLRLLYIPSLFQMIGHLLFLLFLTILVFYIDLVIINGNVLPAIWDN